MREFVFRTNQAVEAGAEDEGKPESQALLCRAARLLLTNVGKHAKATTGCVGLMRKRDRIVSTIDDDGAGLDPAIVADGHIGLGSPLARFGAHRRVRRRRSSKQRSDRLRQMHVVATYLADRQAVDMLWFYLGYEPWHVLVFERQCSWGDAELCLGEQAAVPRETSRRIDGRRDGDQLADRLRHPGDCDSRRDDLHRRLGSCSPLPADDQATQSLAMRGRSGMDTVTSVPGDVERTSNCPPDASTLARIDAIPI